MLGEFHLGVKASGIGDSLIDGWAAGIFQRFPNWSGGFNYEEDKNFRWLYLKILGNSNIELHDLSGRIQFPSFVEYWKVIEKPAGSEVNMEEEVSGASILVEGSGAVELIGTSTAADIFSLNIERLRPHNSIKIGLKVNPRAIQPIEPPDDIIKYIPFYIDLTYHYIDEGEYLPLSYYYELSIDKNGNYLCSRAKDKSEEATLPFRIRII